MRHADHPYTTEDDIWNDIHDLAGVRVILYMPSEDQREKVKRIIQAIWGDHVQPKYHVGSDERIKPDERARLLQAPGERTKLSTKKKYRPRHLGYIAVHYRAKMKENQGTKAYHPKSRDRVEVQVVSALSHAWAEAGHDILYKSYAYGPPTLQEELLLDSLNGIVLSGDMLLEQLNDLVMKRTFAKFRHRGDFQVFLRDLDILQPQDENDERHEFEMDGLDVLLGFLVKTEQDQPLVVRNKLKELGFPDDPKLNTIMAQEIKPSFEPAKGMLITICLLRIMLPPRTLDTPKKFAPRRQCYVMMNALILLQTFFGRADLTNQFLREEITMKDEERKSLDFVLTHCRRQLLLNDTDNYDHADYEDKIKPSLVPAWDWFNDEARKERSICGIVFRLAEMGATKDVEWTTLLGRLTIGGILSRASTGSMEDDLE